MITYLPEIATRLPAFEGIGRPSGGGLMITPINRLYEEDVILLDADNNRGLRST